MATPLRPQAINLGISFRRIAAGVLPNAHTVQNNKRLIPTLNIFKPYGPTSEGEICFTRLRLSAKKRLVNKTAIWAFVVIFNGAKITLNFSGVKRVDD